ncbi:MAG: CDP-alcohol phosphatidyltransferase family protein [Waddliaceae bacterium]
MKKIHLLPNVITAFGLSCGLFVIFKISMTGLGEANPQVLTATAGIMLLAVFADLLDGAIARAIKVESDFGGFFDSLADAITFGVAPSVIVLKTFSMQPGTQLSFLLTTSVMVYSVCGVLRLVRFNVTSVLAKDNAHALAIHRKNFIGLPIPAAAAAAVSANLFLISEEFRQMINVDEETRAWMFICAMILLGYLMVCRWKFPSLKGLRLRITSFQLVFLTVLTAVIIFYGILHQFSVMFFCFSWLYIVVGIILSLVRLISGKRLKTLEDYECGEEEIEWEQ